VICVDSNIAIKWLVPEEHSDRARALLDAALSGQEAIVAPPLLPVEVSNALRQRLRSQIMTLEEALDFLRQFSRFPVTLVSPAQLHERALRLAHQFGLPAVYDAHYLAIADIFRCEMWTDDQRLLRGLRGRFPFARWIGEFAGS